MKIYVVVGPTGIGKSKTGIALAKALHGEVISSDAYQFYRGLNIGTAKLTEDQMDGITHHLIDILEANEPFSVADYQRIVRKKINELMEGNITPILVGGSGLYLQAALYDYRFSGTVRDEDLEKDLELFSNQELWQKLHLMNPQKAQELHVNNRRRILRSIQLLSSEDYVEEKRNHDPIYPEIVLIGLDASRPLIHQYIDQRIDEMMKKGLVEEAKTIYEISPTLQSAQAIGYKEFFPYFEGKNTLEECIELVKKNTKKYAKRQMTWFHNQLNVQWFTIHGDLESTIEEILCYVQTNEKKN
jgi:tRNA dimethylallyltransferase